MDRHGDVGMASGGVAMLCEEVSQIGRQVRALADRQAIVDVFRRYTRGLNRHDIDLLRSAFWSDAQINYGFDSRERDEWIEYWRVERKLKGLACQAHHITNETIDIDGDAAHVESYLIAFRTNEDETAVAIGGRYIDRFDRRGTEWRIAVREFIPHFAISGRSVHGGTEWPQEGPSVGRCDRDDVCYQRPLNPR